MKAHLFTHRDTVLAEMMKKLLELQVSNDLWKSKAKELCAKVAEVTVLQTKHDKRKAATAALKVRLMTHLFYSMGHFGPSILKKNLKLCRCF